MSTGSDRSPKSAPSEPVAVVGVSALFPGSTDAAGFWRDILAGKDCITDVPTTHWLPEDYYDPNPATPDKVYAKRGGFLSPVDFDPLEVGMPPNTVPATDTAQMLAIIVAQKVLEDAARGQFRELDRERISVILGVASGTELLAHMIGRLQRPQWLNGLRASGIPEDEAQAICERIAKQYLPWQESTFPGLLGNVVAGRVANRLNLGGTNSVVDAACAGSLAAMSMAINELHTGQSDLVITGGVDALNDPLMYMCFSKTPALSPTSDIRPFSDKADGTMLGEGVGMVALRRLADAERDGNRIYAVVRGLGSSSDGRAKSIYAPRAEGQAKALRRAYEYAGYGPETVELVEAHGTGTIAGDAAELTGLNLVFSESGRSDLGWCAIGSVKSQIGHTKAAAGAAGLFKAVMALHHKVLPPTVKVERPNPKLALDKSPFYINTKARPWIRGADHPRRASVSSFGFGGSNFHVTVEEYTGAQPALRVRTSPTELVLLTAGSAVELAARCRALAGTQPSLAILARDSQEQAQPGAHRVAIIAAADEDLRQKLTRAADRIGQTAWADPSGIYYGFGEAAGPIAFLFPGQGSQYLEMGADLAMGLDAAREVWDRAASVLLGDARLHDVVFPRPVFDAEARTAQEKRLTATEWVQPALGVASAAQLAVLGALGIVPACVAGHSFGEVTALFAAGVIDEAALLGVARVRGELMAAAAGTRGAMTAVSCGAATLLDLVQGRDVVVANHNSPKQAVISGRTAAVEEIERLLEERKIHFKRLPVATAFHSKIVSAASTPFAAYLEGVSFAPPSIPVFSNMTATPYPSEPAEMKAQLAKQVAHPVLFAEQMEAMYAQGVRVFVEVGAGAVLSRLADECFEGRPHLAVSLDRKGQHGMTGLWHGLGQLWAAGITMSFATLWAAFARPEAPKKRTSTTIQISGANYGKPYPPVAGASALPKPNPPRPKQPVPVPTPAPAQVAAPPPPPQRMPAPPPSASTARAAAPGAPPTPMVSPIPNPTPIVNPAPMPSPISTPIATASPTPVASPTAPAPAVVHAGLSPAMQAILDGVRETQRLSAEAHTAFQQQLAQVSQTLLRTLEASAGMVAVPVSAPVVTPVAASTPVVVPVTASLPVVAPVAAPIAPPMPILAAPVVTSRPAPAPVRATPKPEPTPAARASGVDLQALLLEIVAEKTGYPVDVLSPEMELEAGLGIDSIKRVEILSAMQERVPGLPQVKAAEMAALRTLGEIVVYMKGAGGAQLAVPAMPPPFVSVVSAAAIAPSVDLQTLLLEIVAEKTGYPVDVLSPEMELEAGLGIDSIKRVEILSAMQERVPGLPPVKAAEMAVLRTLGEIVAYMNQGTVISSPALAVVPPLTAPRAPAIDLQAVLLDIVAEKTGYPVDVLSPEMELEAGLGIDSIKRVEILSAMQERVPGLPAVKAAEMATLRTLGEIVAYMERAAGGGQATPAAVAPAAPRLVVAAPVAPSVDLQAVLLEIVAEKTGYPVDVLSPDMELEAGLGIDSIKRVEILSAMQERVPGLPAVKAAEMAALRTLGEIVAYMNQGQAAPTPASVPEAVAAVSPPRAPTIDLHQILLEIVAEKTGYPVDVLTLDMELEAGLGIDSIKRVEILSAMQERVPGLPAVKAAEMAALRTLGEIVAYMNQGTASPAATLPTVSASPAIAAAPPSIARLAVRVVPAPASGFALAGLFAGPVVVTDDGGGVAHEVVARLRARGVAAQVVAEVPAGAGGAILLDGLRVFSDIESALAIDRAAFRAAQAVAAALASGAGIFVTVQDTGGDFGVGGAGVRAWTGGLAALAKTAAQEWPEASVRAIDLARGGRTAAALAQALVDEMLAGGHELEVGLAADGRRVTLVAEATAIGAPVRVVADEHSVIVASGGARGVTAATLVELARGSRARFVLLGRTRPAAESPETLGVPDEAGLKQALITAARAAGRAVNPAEIGRHVAAILAGREVDATLTALRAAGSPARYLACDVQDPVVLAAALSLIRAEWGPITGLVHGAGVLADKHIVQKTQEQFDRVFDTKIAGLRALFSATAQDPLRFIALFSSVAARYGNAGQCDYAMANEILNKVAADEARRRPGCLVKSLNWGPWEGGMVTPALAGHFRERGVALIPIAAGARAFVDELNRGSAEEIEVVLGGGLAAPASRGTVLTVRVDAQSHPDFLDHQVKGTPIVPVVMAMEWFARAARSLRPDLELAACRNLKVLHGIRLPAFEQGVLLHVTAKPRAGTTIFDCELRTPDQRLCYSGSIELAAPGTPVVLPAPIRDERRGHAAAPWTVPQIYDGEKLFHGPRFQVIRALQAIDEAGVVADVDKTETMGWHGGPYLVDPALLDGGLQLARLWELHATGHPSLPTEIGAALFTAHRGARGPLRCVLTSTQAGSYRTVSDMSFYADDGTLVCELRGVQAHLLLEDQLHSTPLAEAAR